MKKTTPVQNIIKVLKTSDKGKLLKAAEEPIAYIDTKIRMTADAQQKQYKSEDHRATSTRVLKEKVAAQESTTSDNIFEKQK